MDFHSIPQKSGFLMMEVSLSLSVWMLFVYYYCSGVVSRSCNLVLKAAFSYGQEMVSVFFAIKLKNFVVILIFIR